MKNLININRGKENNVLVTFERVIQRLVRNR